MPYDPRNTTIIQEPWQAKPAYQNPILKTESLYAKRFSASYLQEVPGNLFKRECTLKPLRRGQFGSNISLRQVY